MKKYYIYFIVVMAFSLSFMLSCQKAELHKNGETRQGLLNFYISIPGQSTQYPATESGPYNNGDTIYVKVPSTEENPLDVTKLKPIASLENNSVITPGLPGLVNFTKPFEITVTGGDGTNKRHIIKVLPVLPRTVFKKLWFHTASEMGILRTNISGLTVLGNDLLVADFNAGSTTGNVGVKVFDRLTSAYKKTILPPTSFAMQVNADQAGHFVVNRYNIYGAGFMLYYYEDLDSSPKLLLNYSAADGCPVNLGNRVSVIGNLKQGKAYVYATTTGINNNYYYWEFNDGVPTTVVPKIIAFSSAEAWTFAVVKRKSLDASSDHYITYCNYVSNDSDLKKGSRFAQFNLNMDVLQMDPSNHFYKILNFEVFEIKGATFLAMLTQGFAAWDATHIKVFDITDPSKMKLVADAPGYSDFSLFTSDAYGGANYNRYGDVAVSVSGTTAYIYATMATNENITAGVMAYSMKYNP